MGEEHRSRADGEHEQRQMGGAHAGGQRHHDAGRGHGGDGGGTGGQSDEHGHEPAGEQRVHRGFGDAVGDHIADAGVDQRLLEAAAGAHDQQDAGHRAEGLADLAVDEFTGAVLHEAEQDHRDDGGDEQRGQRGADEHDHAAPQGFRLTGQIDHGGGEHEHDRQQDHGQGLREGGALRGVLLGVLFGFLLGSLDRDPLGHEAPHQRAGDDDGRDGDQQAKAKRDAEVRVERRNRDERPGVRRHEGVQRGQAGKGGDAEQHDRHLGAAGGEEHHGDQDDDADLEEHGDADDKGDERHRPRQHLQRRLRHDRIDDHVGAARGEQQRADDRTERDEQTDIGHGRSDAGGEAIPRFVERDARADGHDERADHQGEEGMDLDDGDQQHNGRDADDCRDDEVHGIRNSLMDAMGPV